MGATNLARDLPGTPLPGWHFDEACLSKTTFEFKNQLTLEGGWSFGEVHASIRV
jgi:hypothetical protein